MILPKLRPIAQKTVVQREFRGIDRNFLPDRFGFCEMTNLSGENYPVFSPRARRGYIHRLTAPNGLYAKNGLAWVDGTNLYYDNLYAATVTDTPKHFVSMGAYLLVFPDNLLFNTATHAFSRLDATFTSWSQVSVMLSDLTGTAYENVTRSPIAPQSPSDGALWLDTSRTPQVLRVFSAADNAWADLETTYLKISTLGIGNSFAPGQSVTLGGFQNAALNGDFIIASAQSGFIVVPGVIDAPFEQNAAITVERKVPQMDFVVECGNRLWGCSSEKNEIYACKLGDPKTWYAFSGLSSDSYAVNLGSDGDFTGAASHQGNVIFFKENVIHRISGTKPSNFTLTDIRAPGCEKGSEKSSCTLGGNLYYKGRSCFYVYDGSYPYPISKAIDPAGLCKVCAGVIGGRYCVCGQEGDRHALYVFEEETSLWHREDEVSVTDFAADHGELYMLLQDGWIVSRRGSLSIRENGAVYGEESHLETSVSFSAVTPDLGAMGTDAFYLSKLRIRASLSGGASLSVALSYDSGPFAEAASYNAQGESSILIPLNVRRAKKVQLRFSGSGDVRIYSIVRCMEGGSER